jgi:hypothetical protein
MASDSNKAASSQQSVKAYVATYADQAEADAKAYADTQIAIYHTSDFFRMCSVTLADEASVALESSALGNGRNTVLIDITSSHGAAGIVYTQGGANTVFEIADPINKILLTDTDGSLCFLADGDGTYTMKNRLGAEHTFYLLIRGS